MYLILYFPKGSYLKLWSSNPYFTKNTFAISLQFLLSSYHVTKDTPGNSGIIFSAVPAAVGVAEEPTLHEQGRSKPWGHLPDRALPVVCLWITLRR